MVVGGDPRLWSRDDVVAFLRWAEYEFDLPPFDLDMFQMNGESELANTLMFNCKLLYIKKSISNSV